MDKTYIGNDVTLVEGSVWIDGYQSPDADFYISNQDGGYHLPDSKETYDRVSANKDKRTRFFNACRASSATLIPKMDALEAKLDYAIKHSGINLARYS